MLEVYHHIPYILISAKDLSIIDFSESFLLSSNLGVDIINKKISTIFEQAFIEDIKEFIVSEIEEKYTINKLKNNSHFNIINIKKIITNQNTFILLTFIPLKKNMLENMFISKYYHFTSFYNLVSFTEHVNNLLEVNKKIALLTVNIINTGEVIKNFGIHGFFNIWNVISNRIYSVLNKNIICGCFSENIFLFCIEQVSSDEDTLIFIHNEILPIFEKTITIKDNKLRLSTNCGLIFSQKDGDSGDDLIANSLITVLNAKDKMDNILFYCPQKNKSSINTLNLKNDIQTAIKSEELILYYQPYYCLDTGMIKGAEALMRWIKNGKTIPPIDFIPYLEESGLILIVEEWMINKVAKTAQMLKKLCLDVTISLNISPNSFNQRSFYDYSIYKIAKEYSVENHIVFEITERMIFEDLTMAKYTISKLKDNGIKISIDDFGTGNSSLMNLTKIDVDFLKIDMNITQKILSETKVEKVVKSVISMAHSLNAKVIAEGVEDQTMVYKLRNLSCDYGQGYFWSKPIDELSFLQLVESQYVKS